jgi:uroporphyrinogen decarboxylase
MRAQIQLAKQAGLYVMHHDDGAIRPLIPDLIEMGVDMLDPVQWRCKGMDREGLVRDFGADLVFHGGIDNQQTLAFGSPEDVRREVAENIEIFAAARGHIIGPCHNIQTVSPTANVLALYEAAREYGSPPPAKPRKERTSDAKPSTR